MKLSGMDAVNVNVSVNTGQNRVGQGAEAGPEYPGLVSNAEKVAEVQQKVPPAVGMANAANATNTGEIKRYQQDDPDYDKVLKEAVDKVNRVLSLDNRRFEITIHEKTKEVLVKVIDTRTNETIKEIPPRKIVDLVVNLCEMAGIIFDAKG